MQNVIGATIGPAQKKVEHSMLNVSPTFKRGIQWAVLISSLIVFWLLLGFVEDRTGFAFSGLALLSSVYLAFFGLLSVFFLPRKLVWVIRNQASTVAKLSLIVNFFSVLLLLQFMLGTWIKQALGITVLFATVWFGAYILTKYFWPLFCDVISIFQNNYFDPTGPQGRSARFQ